MSICFGVAGRWGVGGKSERVNLRPEPSLWGEVRKIPLMRDPERVARLAGRLVPSNLKPEGERMTERMEDCGFRRVYTPNIPLISLQ